MVNRPISPWVPVVSPYTHGLDTVPEAHLVVLVAERQKSCSKYTKDKVLIDPTLICGTHSSSTIRLLPSVRFIIPCLSEDTPIGCLQQQLCGAATSAITGSCRSPTSNARTPVLPSNRRVSPRDWHVGVPTYRMLVLLPVPQTRQDAWTNPVNLYVDWQVSINACFTRRQ
nr:hypothetical protein CFP56_76713 [Quercus suber]